MGRLHTLIISIAISLIRVKVESGTDRLPLWVWVPLAAVPTVLIERNVLKVDVSIRLQLVTFE